MITDKIRRQVFERDDWACAACGTNQGLTVHHRANRGLGGSKKMDMLSNLLTLCAHHNGLLESDPKFAEIGRHHGWKISKWESPEARPVLYPDGLFYYLKDDGRKE